MTHPDAHDRCPPLATAPHGLTDLIGLLALAMAFACASSSALAQPEPDRADATPASSKAPAAPPADSAAQPRFDIAEMRIEGNSVLPVQRIERAVYRFLGPGKTIADVEAARAALEQLYRDSGYGMAVVDIPEQKVDDGVVVLQVVEGRVARLRVLGSRYYSQSRIVAGVPGLAEGSVPLLPEVQKQIVAVNTSGDKRVTPLLRPGKEPGTTEVDLQVDDQLPLHGGVELNNHHSPNTRAARLVADLRYANLFQREHVLGLMWQASPSAPDEVKVLAANYSLPLQSGTLVLNAVRSDSSTFVGNGVGVFGKGKSYGLRWLRPIVDEASASAPRAKDAPITLQSVTWGADYKNFLQNVALQDGGSIDTPLQYLPFTVSWSGQRIAGSTLDEAGVGWTFALRGLSHNNDAQAANKRFEARANFSVLKFNVGHTGDLANGLGLYAHVDGQYTDQPLISSEQYSAGGADSVRGYLESSVAGDVALRGVFELRRAWPLERDAKGAEAGLATPDLRLFLDAAWLHTRSPLPGSAASAGLAGVGLGASARAPWGLTLRADVAWPLRSTNFQRARLPLLHGSASYQF
jgi:hemolysin activation/secretion protein